MPERIEAVTPDLTQENVEKILALFPNVGTEVQDKETGEIKCAIDFDALRDQLGDVAEGMRERYQFTWPGKRAAKEEARRPIAKTLRPVKERSKNWDDTQNLYIEGDNLDALKILRETYAGKIKMIYIDPPYNTGHDFVYHDHFAQKDNDYKPNNGEHTEEGQLVANPESNGRFHSDWCSMMYPRLLLARDLLSSDGAIFVSLDDNEITNATKIMDEIYGEKNRVAIICHKSRASISNDKVISPNHNLILFYVKNVDLVEKTKSKIGLDPDLTGFDNDDQDNRGPYKLVPVDGPGGARKGNPYYSFLGVEGYWRFSKQTMQEKYQNGLIVKRGDSLAQKYYLAQAKESRKTATTWWDDAGLTSTATANLKTLMGGKTFDAPKPVSLIYRMLQLISYLDKDSIILDFFSGSATTAHAVMQLNAEDGGHRKFIMVQLPEVCDEKSEAAKAGYHTICEIGEERIRRAGEKIKAEVENQQLALGGG
ncbi:DNA methylase N-4 [Bifidobacterium ramosum]|uniref:DNA methylase N-4 n=1 Tax=Bifidobacterium ramosum TaxID=1798158 RepID=A0A6L4WXX6_9BIFI|nr:site-specific DNA-methyltransferase [Bifidobacterium ramosum]KAB8287096.1 DNA methylase N-4 [Bifidobacterium ramosum]